MSGSSPVKLFSPSTPLLPILSSLEGSRQAKPTFTGWEVTCTSSRADYGIIVIIRSKIFPHQKIKRVTGPWSKSQNFLCAPARTGGVVRASSPAMLQDSQNLSIKSKVGGGVRNHMQKLKKKKKRRHKSKTKVRPVSIVFHRP